MNHWRILLKYRFWFSSSQMSSSWCSAFLTSSQVITFWVVIPHNFLFSSYGLGPIVKMPLFVNLPHNQVWMPYFLINAIILLVAIMPATAKSLQSCPTLYNPIDGSPPGSPVPGILQARILEWVAISFSNAWKWSRSVVSNS